MLMVTISTNLPLCVAGQTILKNLFSKILVIYIVCVALPLIKIYVLTNFNKTETGKMTIHTLQSIAAASLCAAQIIPVNAAP